MASDLITAWKIDGETMETVLDFMFWGSKVTAAHDCSHEIKRLLLLGTVKAVSDFIFWGSKITADGDCSHEIKDTYSLEEKL